MNGGNRQVDGVLEPVCLEPICGLTKKSLAMFHF